MNLNKNITLASPTKRFISFAIDFALGAIIGFVLFAFWGSKGLFDDLGGNALWQQAMDFYGSSNLCIVQKDDDGSWKKETPELLDYSVQPADGQEKAGFEYYLDATYVFYTDFLVNNENIDSVDGVDAKDYYGGVYFNTKIMGLPSDLTLVDISNPSTYTSENGYFQYALNDTQTAVDQEAKPVVAEAYQSLVNAEDREILTKLYKLFVGGTNNEGGIYEKAVALLSGQSHLYPISKAYVRVNWGTNAISFAIPLVLFFLLVPMISPNGASIGKLIMNLAVVKNNGVKIVWWQRLVRPLVVAILLSPFVFVPRTHQMFALMGCAILLFGDFAFALRDKTLRYRTLQDRLTGTILIDKKNSVILSSDAEAEQYAIDHNIVEVETKETIKVIDSETILSERSIIDLDVLSNRDEEISSFDSFEERDEDK